MKPLSTFAKYIGLFMAIIAGLILLRVMLTGSIRYVSLGWNIFLAWIPYMLSCYFEHYQKKAYWKQVVLFASWLLFFPNALYIVTDLVHLRTPSHVPWYYDAMLLFSAAFAGLLLAFVSLKNTEQFLRSIFSTRSVRILIPALLFLGSYGVYLGRFERWNSWNVVNDPFALTKSILKSVSNPIEHYNVWAITVLFTLVYSLLYYSINILLQAQKNTGR